MLVGVLRMRNGRFDLSVFVFYCWPLTLRTSPLRTSLPGEPLNTAYRGFSWRVPRSSSCPSYRARNERLGALSGARRCTQTLGRRNFALIFLRSFCSAYCSTHSLTCGG